MQLRDTRKITRPDSNFYQRILHTKASLFRGRSAKPLLLLHYLMRISICIYSHSLDNKCDSGNNNVFPIRYNAK